jgi:hypothetical protein
MGQRPERSDDNLHMLRTVKFAISEHRLVVLGPL